MTILREENFREEMINTVEPYLAARRSVRHVKSEPGKRLYCAFYTAEEAKGVVVMSHGYTETEEKYYELISYFLKAGYHVAMHDHCGHGRSYRLTKKDLCLVHVDSYERYVEDLYKVATAAKETWPGMPMYLYAHSMGGGVGAAFLAKHPEVFQKAVLNAPMIQPNTGNIPWFATKIIAKYCMKTGMAEEYVIGHHAFVPNTENFATGPCSSEARFDYYQEKRESNELYQMSGASYGWINAAIALNAYLIKEGVKNISVPILLFQAEIEEFVCNKAEEKFVAQVNKNAGKDLATLVHIAGSKHEIFHAPTEILEPYWSKIENFLAE